MGNNLNYKKIGAGALLLACVIAAFYLFVPDGASEEYKYTVLKVFQFACLPFFLIGLIFLFCAYRKILGKYGIFTFLILFGLGIIFLCLPIFSPPIGELDWRIGLLLGICWALGSGLLSLGLFLLAARLNNSFSGVLCVFASLALAWFVGESAYLLTPQYGDGKWSDPVHSKYVAQNGASPHFPARPTDHGMWPFRPDNAAGAAAHREMRYSKELFDCQYTMNEMGQRIMPKANAQPRADLLLFGCSFTFGYGMNDEQAWAWQLAMDLGPEWKVENYAYSGFGAQQMLYILEEKMFDAPTAPIRKALFLAIHDQIRRNSGLFDMNAVSYRFIKPGVLGRSILTDDYPEHALSRWASKFNGSQLAREIAMKILTKMIDSHAEENTKLYLAIIEESAKILREQYETELTVLLWPDIENIAPELKARGIPVLFARDMLKDWADKGAFAYQIEPIYETHPNIKAANELAEGLAAYYHSFETAENAR